MSQTEMMLKSLPEGTNVKIENGVISICKVSKKEDGSYDNQVVNMKMKDFQLMMDKVGELLQTTPIDTSKSIDVFLAGLRNGLDPRSETCKCLDFYIKIISNDSHTFSFVFQEYDIVIDSVRKINRKWFIFDKNDVKFRAMKNVCDEFQIFPTHINNISEISPR
ncbi:MAG: hypothetical protein ACRC5M_04450 [Anaeroplasmataceae bacterium]